jgi:hypothetical protein
MNPGLLLDITQIPTKLAGLAAVTTAIAVAMLSLIIPYTALEMNIQAMQSKNPPGYSALLVRTVVVMVCLLCYGTLYSFLLQASQLMSMAVLSEQQWGDFLVQSFSAPDAASPILSWLTHPLSSVQAIVLFLSTLIAVTAKDVVVMLQACFLSLLYAFGPIAIVCGINEKTSAVLRGWIANSFQVAFWSFFLRLVVCVWLTLNPMAGNTGTGVANDFLGILTVNVTFLILVLGTPILAGRLMSGDSIAAFGEAALGAVEAISISRTMKGGKFLSGEVDRYRRDKPEFQKSLFHHPIPMTATLAYNRLFGRSKPAQNGAPKPSNGTKEKGSAQ